MKPSPRRVLAVWKGRPAWRGSFHDVRKEIGATKAQSEKLRSVLEALVSAGRITYERRRYGAANPAPRPAARDVRDARKGGRANGRNTGKGKGARLESTGRVPNRGKTSGKGAPAHRKVSGQEPPPRGESAGRASAPRRVRESRYVAPPARNSAADRGGQSNQESREYTGVFAAHAQGFGFVETPALSQAIFIPPRQIGGALDGDVVLAVMAPRRGRDRDSGRIIGVVERRRGRVRGRVETEHGDRWLIPLNPKLPAIYLEPLEDGAACADGDVVEAEFVSYPEDVNTAPAGRVTRVIADPESPPQIVENLLADGAIPTEFSKATRREMGRLKDGAGEDTARSRVDLSALPFVTIDGADARDFDDAVCLMAEERGRQRLYVAIADVASFVVPGSAVDEDAYARGTSTYLPERVVPMLPERLSNDLCSLVPGQPRRTLTCEMELDRDGHLIDHAIHETTIVSHARLTYDAVAKFLQSGHAQDLGKGAARADMISRMAVLAEQMGERRRVRGSLNFTFPEARFAFAEAGRPIRVDKAFPNRATRLIEQFMLEANETVARHCAEAELPILYRVHDPPPEDQLSELQRQMNLLGVTVRAEALRDPEEINRLLEKVAEHPARESIEVAILRSLTQAQYRAVNDGHFGLAAEFYAHFTSPIRRYPDLMVHRALKNALGSGGAPEGKGGPGLDAAGLHLSTRERAAGDVESRVQRLYRVLYMESKVGEAFAVTVSGVSGRGLWLSLRDHFVDGFLPLALLPDDQYRWDARRQVLRGRRRHAEIRVGEQLTAQLARADRMAQELEFAFAAWGWAEDDLA